MGTQPIPYPVPTPQPNLTTSTVAAESAQLKAIADSPEGQVFTWLFLIVLFFVVVWVVNKYAEDL